MGSGGTWVPVGPQLRKVAEGGPPLWPQLPARPGSPVMITEATFRHSNIEDESPQQVGGRGHGE